MLKHSFDIFEAARETYAHYSLSTSRCGNWFTPRCFYLQPQPWYVSFFSRSVVPPQQPHRVRPRDVRKQTSPNAFNVRLLGISSHRSFLLGNCSPVFPQPLKAECEKARAFLECLAFLRVIHCNSFRSYSCIKPAIGRFRNLSSFLSRLSLPCVLTGCCSGIYLGLCWSRGEYTENSELQGAFDVIYS